MRELEEALGRAEEQASTLRAEVAATGQALREEQRRAALVGAQLRAAWEPLRVAVELSAGAGAVGQATGAGPGPGVGGGGQGQVLMSPGHGLVGSAPPSVGPGMLLHQQQQHHHHHHQQ